GAPTAPLRSAAARPWRALLPFPARAGRGVFEDDAARVEVLPNAIGLAEVPRGSRGPPIRNQLLDFSDRHRWPLVFLPPQRQHPEDLVELLECVAHVRGILASQLAGVDRRIEA